MRRFWLVNIDGVVEMCLKHPGYEVDVTVRCDLRLFVEAWRGFRDMRTEIARGAVKVDGPAHLARKLPDWLMLSSLARFPRRRSGRESRLSGR